MDDYFIYMIYSNKVFGTKYLIGNFASGDLGNKSRQSKF